MAKTATNSNKSNGAREKVVTFYSAGTRATQPLFSDLNRNFYLTMDLIGNPFFSGTQPSGAQSKYDYNRIAISPSEFFVDNLFGAYEYYRISKIETTFQWATNPLGPINGELYTFVDKDGRDAENSNAYINRGDMRRRFFTNAQTAHSFTYVPNMVDFLNDSQTDSVQYIQPHDRWWNTTEFRNHRWGCLRYVAVSNAYDNSAGDQAIFVKHRVWIEVKGQKDLVTPSVPPAVSDLGKQNGVKTNPLEF